METNLLSLIKMNIHISQNVSMCKMLFSVFCNNNNNNMKQFNI